jgi:hypothetical protein
MSAGTPFLCRWNGTVLGDRPNPRKTRSSLTTGGPAAHLPRVSASTRLRQRLRAPIFLPVVFEIADVRVAHADTPGSQSEASAVTGRWSILACLGVLAALVGSPAPSAQTWPSPADLRDFALAEAHEAKLDARVRRHRPSPGNWLSTRAIEDTLAATQFRSIARAAKIGHAREIRIALRVWKPELYAAWRACKEGRGARATCPGVELQYAHARTAVSYVLAQRAATARAPGAGFSPQPAERSPPPVPIPSSTRP